MTFLLTDYEGFVRQDLFDPNVGTPRWATTDIDRAIDKAVDRYSSYYPNIAFADMSTEQYQRTYPYPTPWNASYPVMWVERILYPLQTYGSYFAPPVAGMAAIASSGAGLTSGVYIYAVTFLSQGGETPISPVVMVTTSSGHDQVALSNIPVGPTTTSVPGIAANVIIGRNIYRSQVGGSILTLLSTLRDNVSTSYVDSATDASILNNPVPPTVNSSGVMVWPPYERDFFEFSNVFDSNSALAAGGNLGVMGSPGDPFGQNFSGNQQQVFTLKLTSAELPQDNTSLMRVFYATKHQLDSNGSTIPEIHRDIIVLGACAYAMEAYQVPTSDNFDFQDGGLRDRVDDTKIPEHWAASAANKMSQFIDRLTEIKQQRDFASSAKVAWGDVPARWPRL